MKRNRVVVGVLVTIVVVVILGIDHFYTRGFLSAAILAALAFMASWELCAVLESMGMATYQRLTAFFAFVVTLVPAALFQCHCRTSPFAVEAGIIFGFVMLAFVLAMRGGDNVAGTKAVAAGTFVLIYVGFGLSLFVRLREMPDIGEALVFFTLAVAKGGDMGAYFAGTRLGKHKLAPRLSPKKTVEGSLGAIAASLVIGFLIWLYVSKAVTLEYNTYIQSVSGLWIFLGSAAVISIAAQFGDLAESLLKRAADVKDSSVAFGTMGGMLDLVDSLLLSVPVAYILALLGGFGG